MSEKRVDGQLSASTNNPNVQSSGGGINPSAPSTGISGLSTAPDERRQQVGQNNPGASSVRPPHADRSFCCADAVQQDCKWSVTGNSEDEILGYMRVHAREAHGKSEFTTSELAQARRAIHKRAA